MEEINSSTSHATWREGCYKYPRQREFEICPERDSAPAKFGFAENQGPWKHGKGKKGKREQGNPRSGLVKETAGRELAFALSLSLVSLSRAL